MIINSANINSMNAHQTWMNNNAQNVANVNSENYTAVDTVINEGVTASTRSTGAETDITTEITDQIVIEKGFSLQTSAIKTEDEMIGTLLNMKG